MIHSSQPQQERLGPRLREGDGEEAEVTEKNGDELYAHDFGGSGDAKDDTVLSLAKGFDSKLLHLAGAQGSCPTFCQIASNLTYVLPRDIWRVRSGTALQAYQS